MSRLQGRIDQTREEEVRPRVPRVEGPLSERPRPEVHIPWALGEEAARGFAEPNSEPEEVQIETPAGADLGGGCRGCAPLPPPDDLRFSNTTGILQKKNYVVYWC